MNERKSIVNNPDGSLIKFLVVWYGIYQAAHIIINLRALVDLKSGEISFPAFPPPDGWSVQTIHFFTGMAAVDLFNAVLTLVFVYSYFKNAKWRMWLGTLTLTASMYAAIVFNYGTMASGAWTENLIGYLFLNVAFIPVVILFILMGIWAIQGKFLESDGGEEQQRQ
jgi:hypothetical protein